MGDPLTFLYHILSDSVLFFVPCIADNLSGKALEPTKTTSEISMGIFKPEDVLVFC